MWEVFEATIKERGLTIADVVKGTGISYSTISNWKTRRNFISAKNGRLIAEYLGLTYDYLMTGNESEPKYNLDDRAVSIALRLMQKPYLMDLMETAMEAPEETVRSATSLLSTLIPKATTSAVS